MKLNQGDSPYKGPLSKRNWNRTVDSSDNYNDREALGTPRLTTSHRNRHNIINLRNDCGVNLRRGEVLELDGSAVHPDAADNSTLWFKGVDPDLTHIGWAIALVPIPYNDTSRDYGDALLYGVCLAYVQVDDDDHEFAGRKSGQRVLHSAATGPVKIIEKITASGESEGEYLCWVQIMDEAPALVQFTTTEYMAESTPGAAEATLNWLSNGASPPSDPVKVYHINSQFPDVHEGAKGTGVFDWQTGEYRIVSSQRVAMRARAILAANLCPDAEEFSDDVEITDFIVEQVGDYVGAPPESPEVVKIGTIKAGMEGDAVTLRRINNNMPNPDWEIESIDKRKVEPIVDIEVTETELKGKTRKIWGEVCDEEETEVTIDTLNDCDEEEEG